MKFNRTICFILLFVMIASVMFTTACDSNSLGAWFKQIWGGDNHTAIPDPIDDNYRVFYQIFVGSFSDSNGDGIGDLRGIIDRFDYLNDGDISNDESLGVQGIWLSPIFISPTYHKYDTTNYYMIDPKFGTEEDLKELIALCHERNVKIILDLVINHTSILHPWFIRFKDAQKSGDVEDQYYDYYTNLAPEDRKGGVSYNFIPGMNDRYYECNFSSDMPELNLSNELVREEMLNIAKYYLEMGIDGFRFDAVKYIYYGDTQKSVDFWEWYMGELKKIKPDIYCIGECWSSESEILEYYNAMNCFNFGMSGAESNAALTIKGSAVYNYTKYIEKMQDRIQEKNSEGMHIPFLSNHDMDRISGSMTVASHRMHMIANLYILSHGSPVIYYGEEIGMKGFRSSEPTDANRRLAMLWGDGDTVKDPEGTTYSSAKQTNGTVAYHLENENTLLKHYRNLIAIRNKYPAIARGEYKAIDFGEKRFGGYLISYENEVIGLFHNTGDVPMTIDLSQYDKLNGYTFSELCDYVGVGDAKLEGTILTISGYTSVILK